jgi:hypothetical protein
VRLVHSIATMNDASAPPTHCANCDAPLADRYCGRCGQDSHASLSFGHFTHELVEGLFHVDSKFWRTLRTLLIRPGLLTQQYLDGRRNSYSPPFRSYLVISIAYFVVASIFDTAGSRVIAPTGQELTAADCAQMAAHPGWALRFVPDLEALCTRALSNDRHALSAAVENLLPKVMFVVLPLVALVQYWIFRRQRPLYLENLVFVLHFQSFYYLASAITLLLAAGIAAFTGSRDAIGQAFELFVYLFSFVYLFIAERRVYRAGKLKIVFGLLAVAVAYVIFYSLGVAVAGMYAFLHA